jgi:hypothetical protein
MRLERCWPQSAALLVVTSSADDLVQLAEALDAKLSLHII